jgi:thymidylate kinase
MLIKSVGYFPYKSSNLDVLIKQNKRDKAQCILKKLGYFQLHNAEEPYKTLFRKFKGHESTSIIHLHNKVAWINPFHEEELLWAQYRKSYKDDLLDIPSPEDSILILTAHWFYEDKEIKLSDLLNILTCLNNKVDWNYVSSVAEKFGWIDGLYFGLLVQSFLEKNIWGKSLIEDSQLKKFHEALPVWLRIILERKIYTREISLPFKISKSFGKSLHFVKTLNDRTTSIKRKIYELVMVAYASLFVILFYKFNVNIRYQPSMLISISGVDGSGKSTYAECLAEILNICEIKTRIVWSRVGSSHFLKPLSKVSIICHKLKKGKSLATFAENHEESIARRKDIFKESSVLGRIGILFLLIEMLFKLSFKVAISLLFKRVVICDRYTYDAFVDLKTRYSIEFNNKRGKFFRTLLTKLTPKAVLSYVLIAPFDEVSRRRDIDTNTEPLLRDQISAYQEIAKFYDLTKICNSNGPAIAEISEKMINQVLYNYYGKWPSKKMK